MAIDLQPVYTYCVWLHFLGECFCAFHKAVFLPGLTRGLGGIKHDQLGLYRSGDPFEVAGLALVGIPLADSPPAVGLSLPVTKQDKKKVNRNSLPFCFMFH